MPRKPVKNLLKASLKASNKLHKKSHTAMRTFTSEELLELAKTTTETLMDYYEESDCDWHVVDKTSFCLIKSRKSKEFNGLLYRAEGIVPVPPKQVFEIMRPEAYFDGSALEWETSIKRTELVEKVTDNVLVMRSTTHSFLSGVISSRDFVDVINMTKIGESRFTAAASIDYPLTEGHVRGKNYTIGVIASPVPGEPDQCMLTRFLQTDPGGCMPQYLADSVVPTFLSKFYAGINSKLQELVNDDVVTSDADADTDVKNSDVTPRRSWTFGLW